MIQEHKMPQSLSQFQRNAILALGYTAETIDQYSQVKDKYDDLFELEEVDEQIRYYTAKKSIIKSERKLKRLIDDYLRYKASYELLECPSDTKTHCLQRKYEIIGEQRKKISQMFKHNFKHSSNFEVKKFKAFCKDNNISLSEDPKE